MIMNLEILHCFDLSLRDIWIAYNSDISKNI